MESNLNTLTKLSLCTTGSGILGEQWKGDGELLQPALALSPSVVEPQQSELFSLCLFEELSCRKELPTPIG